MEKGKSVRRILDPVYVVTRNGRRADSKNFISKSAAHRRAKSLISMVKEFDPSRTNEIDVIKTTSPHKVR